VLIVMLTLFSGANIANAQIVGSKHDLSRATGGGNWGGTSVEDQVCIYCHTPHHASTTQLPLWNRQDATETFTPYDSPTYDGTFTDPGGQPQGESKLCMSCHDGVTALNALVHSYSGMPVMDGGFDQLGDVYYPGSPFSPHMGANIGELFPGGSATGNLANDHPISFTFDAALIATDADGGDPRLQLPAGDDAVRLFGPQHDQLECSSCHDVHNNTSEPFLVMDNAGSSMCMKCHIK
jgi:predicted CXXCH cytochrome family protein